MQATTRRISRGATPALLVAALLGPGLAGCTDPGPQAQDAAADLAQALAAQDLSDVVFTEMASKDAQAHLEAVFGALGDIELSTKVESVTEVSADAGSDSAQERAIATIGYSWQVTPERPWSYHTEIPLVLVETDAGSGWEVDWAPDMLVPDLASNERLTTSRLQPARADILGQGDAAIVTSRPVNHLGIDKTHLDPSRWDAQARALATVVGIDPEAYAQKVAAAGPKAFVEAITLRQSQTVIDVAAAGAIEGVSTLPDELPLAPTKDFARPILGRAGEATQEIVEASGGEIVAGDTVGLSGLQRQYDAQLRGIPGIAIAKVIPVDVGGDGKPVELFRVDAVNGTPLQTTFDIALQERAEALLADQGVPSAIVAIRPSTGEVLAAASGPASEGLSTATVGQYAPGSTFKIATALAAMRGGTTPDTTVSCTGQIAVGGRTFSNVPGYPSSALGDVPFRTAFANSCNTAMISLSGAVSQQALHDAAADLGLGVTWDLGAPAYGGDVPTQAPDVEHAASMIGQGKIQASPLAMATVAASVANGARVSPVLVHSNEAFAQFSAPSGAASGSAAPAPSASATAAPPTPSNLTAEEADTLRSLMRSVVTDGSATVLTDLGPDIGAKTGTAQYGDGSKSHVWMIAFDGDLAVAVFLETGETGATTAGPIMHAFLVG